LHKGPLWSRKLSLALYYDCWNYLIFCFWWYRSSCSLSAWVGSCITWNMSQKPWPHFLGDWSAASLPAELAIQVHHRLIKLLLTHTYKLLMASRRRNYKREGTLNLLRSTILSLFLGFDFVIWVFFFWRGSGRREPSLWTCVSFGL